MSTGRSIAAVFDQTWDRFLGRLQGLHDDEYFWEPVPQCWSVRQGDDGSWKIDGNGGDHSPASPPYPSPFTTIAWRIEHIGLTFIGFGDRLFFEGEVTLWDVGFASSASKSIEALTACYQHYWRDGLDDISQAQWSTRIGPAFGSYSQQCTTDLALHVLDEFIHHAAEVSLLRDLYLRRDTLAVR